MNQISRTEISKSTKLPKSNHLSLFSRILEQLSIEPKPEEEEEEKKVGYENLESTHLVLLFTVDLKESLESVQSKIKIIPKTFGPL